MLDVIRRLTPTLDPVDRMICEGLTSEIADEALAEAITASTGRELSLAGVRTRRFRLVARIRAIVERKKR